MKSYSKSIFLKMIVFTIGINLSTFHYQSHADEINEIMKNKVAIYDLSADKRENKIGGDKLEKYPLQRLPKFLQNNLINYKEWID